MVIFVDDFSRFGWLFPPKTKSEIAAIFPIFKAFVENQFQSKIKKIQIDGGSEYKPLCILFFINVVLRFESLVLIHLNKREGLKGDIKQLLN